MRDSPERQLWCAVIVRALDDSRGDVSAIGPTAERGRIQDEAKSWFAENRRDFRLVCEHAGYDPDVVRGRILVPR